MIDAPAPVVPFRPATAEDFPRLAALLALDEAHATGRPSRLTESDLAAWLARVDLGRDTWLHEDGGRLVAFGWHELTDDVAFGVGIVHPEARGRGLGTALVRTAERRGREAGGRRMHYAALAGHGGAPALLAAHGFREVRRFYEMAIELDGAPAEHALEDGLELERFTSDDARAFHDAIDEAFQDHWEHHSRPFEEWWDEKQKASDFDPTLWFLVRDGAEVAAAVRNDPNRNGGGWIGALGVRRPWRGRGLGRALLLRSFAEFHRRGVNRISLGVDAESPTGATRLYASVGMVPELEQVVFEKALA